MDEKLESLLMQILESQNKTNTRLDKIDNRLNALETDVKSLQEGQGRIESKLDALDDKVGNFEPLNAKRHIEIADKIDKLSANLNVVEAVTSKNWNDIALLKIVK